MKKWVTAVVSILLSFVLLGNIFLVQQFAYADERMPDELDQHVDVRVGRY